MKTESPMRAWTGFLDGWSTARRLSFGLTLAGILGVVVGLAWWAQHKPKAVLFSELAERDAALLAAELDKLKQPYAFSEDGHAILVAAESVHRTRLALMGKQLPLQGGVGFELFNNADFGVSDFVQKINYQRALQGELTRTILAIDQVRDARVHLALPDPGAFRKDGPKAKASVSVSLKGGQTLRGDQVAGMQRLVAASVPEIKTEDVTVLDQHGVVLSRAAGEEAVQIVGQLDARQSLEAHLSRKATRLLDQMFRPGDAQVAVDVVLNHEQSRVTTEEVVAAAQADRSAPAAGVITRERIVSREPVGEAAANSPSAQVLTQETDYQTGKRVAQIVSQGGQIAHLNVAVVVKRHLAEAELARVRQLVAAAVGLVPARGDAVAVHAMAEPDTASVRAADHGLNAALVPKEPAPRAHGTQAGRFSASPTYAVLAIAAGALLISGSWWWLRQRRRRLQRAQAPLNEDEREALLATLKHWLEPQS